MIIVFIIIYLIILLWLFDLQEKKEIVIDDISNYDIDIIINNTTSINQLLITIDSIRRNNYPTNKINIIIFENTLDDLVSILDIYNNQFLSIRVFKISQFNEVEYFNNLDLDTITSSYMFIINSGSTFSRNLITSGIYYINNFDISIIYLPIINDYINRIDIYLQINNFFHNGIFSSFVNRGLNREIDLYSNSIIIKSDCFFDLINNKRKIKDFNQKYILDNNLIINFANQKKSMIIKSYIFNILYYITNLCFILGLAGFLLNPSFYFLAAIILKIVPELSYVYSYYNRLEVKFPKFEFFLYSIINPFYIFIKLLPRNYKVK